MLPTSGIVYIHEDGICIVVTEISVGIVPGKEMHGFSVMDDLLALSPLEKFSRKIMKSGHLSLRYRISIGIHRCGGPAPGREQINGISFPSSREIHSQAAMPLGFVPGDEHHLVSVKNLGNAGLPSGSSLSCVCPRYV